jgi:hypothetical protein
MRKFQLSRRTMLRGMLKGAAISIALPPLEAFFGSTGKAYASGEAIPKRFGLFFWGNGVVPEHWIPTGTGSTYSLSPILMPLAGLTDSFSVISGMRVMTPNLEPHTSGAAGILSGGPVRRTDHTTFLYPSIDQVIAGAIGDQTRFKSLEFGAHADSGLSYNGPDDQNPPETSPAAFFNRLFVDGYTPPGGGGMRDPMLDVRKSILDAVTEDANSLRKRLGAIDKQRLDQHLSGIRELEMRIANTTAPTLAACMTPDMPLADYPSIEGREQVSARNRAFSDIIAMALACDQTRVFSNFITNPVNNVLFPGATAGHHQLTHDELGDQPQVTAICVQIMEELAYFLQKLKSVPEGDGTLLDHCAVLCTTDVSLGRTHALDEFPIVIAGTASGALKTGFHYRSEAQENVSKVLLSLCHAMDVLKDDFGYEEGHVTSGLSEIEA